jgi:F-box protein 9
MQHARQASDLEPTYLSLIHSFGAFSIESAEPLIEGDIPPPCPIAKIPSEILIQILRMVATEDLNAFVKVGQTCKTIAYLVSTEESIWRDVLAGEKYGLAGMKTKFETGILGNSLPNDNRLDDYSQNSTTSTIRSAREGLTPILPNAREVYESLYQSSYRTFFHDHPRIRFTGLYISTVNYARPGASSPNQVSWNTPVHIVTYYRYLRFFRDGTLLSLLTASEPSEVVPLFTKDASIGKDVSLSATMRHALRGRWRIAPPSIPCPYLPNVDNPTLSSVVTLDEIDIETEGPAGGCDKYIYKLRLAIRNTSSGNQNTTAKGSHGAKSTRLLWKGFWSYNCISDDWSVFRLRNDRAFVWVKVGAWRGD